MSDHRDPDELPSPRDARNRIVAIVLIACLVLTMGPFLLSLFI